MVMLMVMEVPMVFTTVQEYSPTTSSRTPSIVRLLTYADVVRFTTTWEVLYPTELLLRVSFLLFFSHKISVGGELREEQNSERVFSPREKSSIVTTGRPKTTTTTTTTTTTIITRSWWSEQQLWELHKCKTLWRWMKMCLFCTESQQMCCKVLVWETKAWWVLALCYIHNLISISLPSPD